LRSKAYPKPGKAKNWIWPVNTVGYLGVLVLRSIQPIPIALLNAGLSKLLPFYPRLRPGQSIRLKNCFSALSFQNSIDVKSYYQMRLKLLLTGIHYHGQSMDPSLLDITGLEHYRKALDSGRPVALLGFHSGVLELLHRIPEKPAGKPFLILTAPAFAPALTTFMAKGRIKDGKEIIWNRTNQPMESHLGHPFYTGLRLLVKQKGVLAMMVDQHPEPQKNSKPLILWGRIVVPYPVRLLKFLINQDFIFVPVTTILQSTGKSSFTYHPIWDFGKEQNSQKQPHPGTDIHARLQKFLENEICTKPDQWNWSYPKIRLSEKRSGTNLT
jgi:lauroyl/myristoyl acyltransferase